MINKLPIIGWMLSIIGSISLSIPFYFMWNWLSPKYFYFIPDIYQDIPFWHCVGLFIVVPIVKKTLTPNFVTVANTNLGTKDK